MKREIGIFLFIVGVAALFSITYTSYQNYNSLEFIIIAILSIIISFIGILLGTDSLLGKKGERK